MMVLELRDAGRVDIIAWWNRAWPPTALAVALIVDLAWVGLLGYGLVRLL
jgi:hypothetical protein